jgi:transposase InsO family protein
MYYDARQPGSFQSFRKLHRTVRNDGYKLGTNRLRRWLQNQLPYSRNRLYLPKAIKRARVIVNGLYDQFDADLADFRALSQSNDGINYLLVVIDVFSRYCWVEPLPTKSNSHVIAGLKRIMQRAARVPRRLRTDNGKEFTGRAMEPFYDTYNITHFVAMNEVKANYAERIIKTIKSKLSRYMSFTNTSRYIDVVQDIIHSYNNTYHNSIEMTPAEVTQNNEKVLWWMQYHPTPKFHERRHQQNFKFHEGDHVRIPMVSTVFRREYSARWTDEIFIVIERFRRQGINMYRIEDRNNEPIYGTFYEAELQRVVPNSDNHWQVESIIKQRGHRQRGDHEAWVKFRGWPTFYNRWIPYIDAHNDLTQQQQHMPPRS